MKKINILLVATTLAALSFGSFAAELVSSQPQGQQRIGVINVSDAADISSLQDGLAQKADRAGAKSFRIIAASGDNRLHGTAIIYK